ncbi:MAG TPA: LysE family transporter [Bacteroidales bacterium]|nr:LysE family transporter [Bacteroidales bacterium]HRZ76542.1 LysE family transporter [Bacteroidales bacterium]
MAPLLEGILLGLTLAILLGPAFFALLQTAMHRGFRSAAILAMGVFLSDISMVYLSTIGAERVLENKGMHLYFGIIGGFVLIGTGIYTFTRKVVAARESELPELKVPGPLTFLLKGFFLNITNPFLWIFWMSVVISVSSNYGINTPDMYVFFLGLLGTVILTDLLKCYGAHLISGLLKPRVLTTVNRVVGVFLVLFGILLIARIGMGY